MDRFVRDVVMKASNANIMNSMQRCVLTLYSYDEDPEDISVENVLQTVTGNDWKDADHCCLFLSCISSFQEG